MQKSTQHSNIFLFELSNQDAAASDAMAWLSVTIKMTQAYGLRSTRSDHSTCNKVARLLKAVERKKKANRHHRRLNWISPSSLLPLQQRAVFINTSKSVKFIPTHWFYFVCGHVATESSSAACAISWQPSPSDSHFIKNNK